MEEHLSCKLVSLALPVYFGRNIFGTVLAVKVDKGVIEDTLGLENRQADSFQKPQQDAVGQLGQGFALVWPERDH